MLLENPDAICRRLTDGGVDLSTFLEAVIAHIPSMVLVMDASSRGILLANCQAEALLGRTRAEMQGQTAQACLPAPLAAVVERLTDEALDAAGVTRDEEPWETARGSRILRTDTLVFHGADPRSRYVLLIANDVTDENAAHATARYLAHHDTLTGMPNRRLFREKLLEALPVPGLPAPARHRRTAVLCLDLDNFKGVNDTLGHQAGDDLLRMLAERLPTALRDQDTIARLGGDEFAVVLPGIERDEDVRMVAERLIDVVRPAFEIDGHAVSVGVSIGITLAGQEDLSADQLLRRADMALYEAKRNGRNQLAFFRIEMEAAALKRRDTELPVRAAPTSAPAHPFNKGVLVSLVAAALGDVGRPPRRAEPLAREPVPLLPWFQSAGGGR